MSSVNEKWEMVPLETLGNYCYPMPGAKSTTNGWKAHYMVRYSIWVMGKWRYRRTEVLLLSGTCALAILHKSQPITHCSQEECKLFSEYEIEFVDFPSPCLEVRYIPPIAQFFLYFSPAPLPPPPPPHTHITSFHSIRW